MARHKLTSLDNSLWARDCSQHFTSLFNLILLVSTLCQGENWGTESLGHLSNHTQAISNRARICNKEVTLHSQPMFFNLLGAKSFKKSHKIVGCPCSEVKIAYRNHQEVTFPPSGAGWPVVAISSLCDYSAFVPEVLASRTCVSNISVAEHSINSCVWYLVGAH